MDPSKEYYKGLLKESDHSELHKDHSHGDLFDYSIQTKDNLKETKNDGFSNYYSSSRSEPVFVDRTSGKECCCVYRGIYPSSFIAILKISDENSSMIHLSIYKKNTFTPYAFNQLNSLLYVLYRTQFVIS